MSNTLLQAETEVSNLSLSVESFSPEEDSSRCIAVSSLLVLEDSQLALVHAMSM